MGINVDSLNIGKTQIVGETPADSSDEESKNNVLKSRKTLIEQQSEGTNSISVKEFRTNIKDKEDKEMIEGIEEEQEEVQELTGVQLALKQAYLDPKLKEEEEKKM